MHYSSVYHELILKHSKLVEIRSIIVIYANNVNLTYVKYETFYINLAHAKTDTKHEFKRKN